MDVSGGVFVKRHGLQQNVVASGVLGNLLMQNELARAMVPDLPLDVLVAQTEGSLGYILQQELLNELSAGNIDPDFLLKKREANPIESTCEIRLFLQRQRPGQFDVTFDSGRVTGSSSAEVTVIYIPPVPTN